MKSRTNTIRQTKTPNDHHKGVRFRIGVLGLYLPYPQSEYPWTNHPSNPHLDWSPTMEHLSWKKSRKNRILALDCYFPTVHHSPGHCCFHRMGTVDQIGFRFLYHCWFHQMGTAVRTDRHFLGHCYLRRTWRVDQTDCHFLGHCWYFQRTTVDRIGPHFLERCWYFQRTTVDRTDCHFLGHCWCRQRVTAPRFLGRCYYLRMKMAGRTDYHCFHPYHLMKGKNFHCSCCCCCYYRKETVGQTVHRCFHLGDHQPKKNWDCRTIAFQQTACPSSNRSSSFQRDPTPMMDARIHYASWPVERIVQIESPEKGHRKVEDYHRLVLDRHIHLPVEADHTILKEVRTIAQKENQLGCTTASYRRNEFLSSNRSSSLQQDLIPKKALNGNSSAHRHGLAVHKDRLGLAGQKAQESPFLVGPASFREDLVLLEEGHHRAVLHLYRVGHHAPVLRVHCPSLFLVR